MGASLEGDVTLRGVKSDVETEFSDILEKLNFAAQVHAEARRNRLGFFGDLLFMQLSDEQDADSLKIETTAQIAIVEVGTKYRVGSFDLPWGGNVGVDTLVSGRYWRTRTEIDLSLGLSDVDRTVDWVDLIVGGTALLELSDRWNLNVRADLGGFGIGSGTDRSIFVRAMFRYQFTEDWSTLFGYSILDAELDRGTKRLKAAIRLDGIALAFERRF